MRHPRSSKPESIANAQSEIQIVDTHESIETRISIGLAAALLQINRTLVIFVGPENAAAMKSEQHLLLLTIY